MDPAVAGTAVPRWLFLIPGVTTGALAVADNGTVAMVEGLLLVGVVGVLLYLAIRALPSGHGQELPPSLSAGHWRTAHYDVGGHTKVVVQKVTPAATHVLDEHVIAE